MPELRKDPVVGRWVIMATERSRRPSDLSRITRNARADHVYSAPEWSMSLQPKFCHTGQPALRPINPDGARARRPEQVSGTAY